MVVWGRRCLWLALLCAGLTGCVTSLPLTPVASVEPIGSVADATATPSENVVDLLPTVTPTPQSTLTPVPTATPIPTATPTTPAPSSTALPGAPFAVDLLGMVTWPTGTRIFDTELGGLSALSYDAATDTYYVLSDDRGREEPPRLYQFTLDLDDGLLQPGDVTWQAVIPLRTAGGAFFTADTIDPEGLVFTGERFWVASEGDARLKPPLPPAIFGFTPAGELLISLTIPEKYLPARDAHRGVRSNRAFESLTLTPDGQFLVTAVENALAQDGPRTDLEQPSPVRWLWFEAATGRPVREIVYVVEPIPFAPLLAGGRADNGLSDLIALDNDGHFLALERGYALGRGNAIRLYWVETADATEVQVIDPLPQPLAMVQPARKTLVVDLASLVFRPDNIEGMTLGPRLADGRQVLLLVSDNNFSQGQTTQLIALALTPSNR